MRNTAFIGLGLALILVQANLYRALGWIHLPGLLPSLILPLILFMGVHEYSMARGAAVAFLLGYVSDVVGGAPIGVFTFTSVTLFVLARRRSPLRGTNDDDADRSRPGLRHGAQRDGPGRHRHLRAGRLRAACPVRHDDPS